MHRIANTLLSLDEFAHYMDLNPWYVAQFSENLPLQSGLANREEARCADAVIYERGWLGYNRLSRHMIAHAIKDAEDVMADYLNYWPAPTYITDEDLPLPEMKSRSQLRRWLYANPNPIEFQTRWKYIQAVGIETLAFVADAAVSYTDGNSDSFNELAKFTVTVPAGTLASEIAVFFRSTDIGEYEDETEWEIFPLSISVNSTTNLATILGKAYQFALPEKYTITNPTSLDTTNILNYAGEVAVYTRTTDTTNIGQALVQDGCTLYSQDLCVTVINAKLGILAIHYNGDTATTSSDCAGTSRPYRVTLNYLSGYPRSSRGMMDRGHALALSKLAVSYLENLPCGCACEDEGLLAKWRNAPSFVAKSAGFSSSKLVISKRELEESPFPVTEGGLAAYRFAKNKRILIGSTG